MPVVALLTDFGQRDHYLAAVKGVLLARAPGVTLVDVTHDVDPGDVEAAGFLLGAAAPWFPAGTIFMTVVDPGVGGRRRILAARAGGRLFLAPDNGVLSPVLRRARVHVVSRPDLVLPGPGRTFDGRDRFAPAAAFLASGGPLAALGPAVADAKRLPLRRPRRHGRRLTGHVTHVDRFGNLLTDLPNAWLSPAIGAPATTGGRGRRSTDPPSFTAMVGARATRCWATHYGAIPRGQAAVLPGSLGTLELALDRASLAAAWGVERGRAVTVRLETDGHPEPPQKA